MRSRFKKNNSLNAVINLKSYKSLFKDVRNFSAFKRGYEKEMLREFAEAIRLLRTKNGYSQKDVAKRAGTKQQVISKLENGVDDIKLSTFFRIAHVLHMDLAGFVHSVHR